MPHLRDALMPGQRWTPQQETEEPLEAEGQRHVINPIRRVSVFASPDPANGGSTDHVRRSTEHEPGWELGPCGAARGRGVVTWPECTSVTLKARRTKLDCQGRPIKQLISPRPQGQEARPERPSQASPSCPSFKLTASRTAETSETGPDLTDGMFPAMIDWLRRQGGITARLIA